MKTRPQLGARFKPASVWQLTLIPQDDPYAP